MSTKLIVTLASLLFYYAGVANTFTVTSNADSGPGTLREAINLANANGTAAMDYISFNIADQSIAGRTIGLLTALPYLTSNTAIDGTTQPGAKIGVSDAKIRITNPTGVTIEQVFVISDAVNVSIYGIHFASLNFNYDPNNGTAYAAAIRLHNATNVAIGAIGKGNYFTKQTYALADLILPFIGHGFSTDISFKSNIVNLTEDGNSVDDCCTKAISLTNVRNFEIGGDDPKEGNFIDGGYYNSTIGVDTDTLASVNTGFLKLINNNLGCNYTKTVPLLSGSVFFINSNNYASADTCQVTVKNNSYNFIPPSSSFDLYGFLGIQNKSGFIDIKGNKIMLLSGGPGAYFEDITDAIDISGCENGIIGGPGPNDTNYIVACDGSGISLYNNKNITITKNSLWCNNKGITSASDKVIIPKTKIFTLTDYTAAGTVSVPNCTIEVFLNKSLCQHCNNGKTYIGSVSADAQGNWTFTSPILLDGPVTATATTSDSATGEFAHPEHDGSQIVSSNPACHQNNGYIHGMKFISGTRYYWVHNDMGVSDTTFAEDIDSLAPGQYTFVVEQGKYCFESGYVLLADASPQIDSTNKTLTNPTCGLYNGSITNIVGGNYNEIIWQDAGYNIVGNSFDLFNVGEGQYRLIVLDTIHGCSDTTKFFTLTNQSGPTLNTASIIINPSTCESSNGSITGLTASNVNGTAIIQWYDSLNNIAGNNYDLQNIPPGKYRFIFKDAGGCDTIRSPYYIVADSGLITIDTTGMLVTASKCATASGSIGQIQVTGGSTYRWFNTTGNTSAGSTADIFNLPAGTYQLTVTNSFGCSKTSPVINVPQSSFSPIMVTGVAITNALCSQNIGSVAINNFSTATAAYAFRWIDSASGQYISNAVSISGLGAGTYQLFATDSNGCEKNIYNATIQSIPPPVINYTASVITNDECRLKQGGVALDITGLSGPTSYTWYDENEQVVGTGANLQNVVAGAYTVTVTDGTVCTVHSDPFLVGNVNNALSPPAYDDITIPRNTNAAINNKNAPDGDYKLYATAGSTQPTSENNSGNFVIPAVSQDTTVYISRSKGFCFSEMVAVHITVVDKAYFTIPTAFTPNGDGVNDKLTVRGVGIVTLNYFRVYNQWGKLVFETNRLNDGWDGSVNGVIQNTASFVWIAQGKDITGTTVTGKGAFVLIH